VYAQVRLEALVAAAPEGVRFETAAVPGRGPRPGCAVAAVRTADGAELGRCEHVALGSPPAIYTANWLHCRYLSIFS
jgi:hypothetical protein